MKNQEDDFYEDVDKKSMHKSCCTFPTLIGLFLIILIFSIGAVVYYYDRIRQTGFIKNHAFSVEDSESFLQKSVIDRNLTNFKLTLTSDELSAAGSSGISGKNLLFKNINIRIGEDKVYMSGNLLKPLNTKLSIETKPRPQDGRIKFEILKVVSGSQTLPKFTYGWMEDDFAGFMDKMFGNIYANGEIQTINLFDDKMEIEGEIK